jgi:hypothetical protein
MSQGLSSRFASGAVQRNFLWVWSDRLLVFLSWASKKFQR